MAHDTRASQRTKDGEDATPKGKDGAANLSMSSDATTLDSSVLRRSNRDASAKKNSIPRPSSAWNSERLENQTPKTPSKTPAKRKLDEFKKQSETVSLRRSERGKNPDRSSGSPILEKQHKKDKSMKQLTLETELVTNSERRKKRDSRAYKDLFLCGNKINATGNSVEVREKVKLSEECSIDSRIVALKNLDGEDQSGQRNVQEARARDDHFGRYLDKNLEEFTSSVIKYVMKTVDNVLDAYNYNVEQADPDEHGTNVEYSNLLLSSLGTVCGKMNDIAEEAQEIIGQEVANAFVEKWNTDHTVRSDISGSVMTSKPQEGMGESTSDAIALGLSKDVRSLASDVVQCSPDRCKDDNSEETSASCNLEPRITDTKQQRFCSGNTNLDQDLCGASLLQDTAEMETHVSEGRAEQCMTVLQAEGLSTDFQPDGNKLICSICKLGGKLICCGGKGCQGRYHHSCLDPHLKDIPFGVWHCYLCARKKVLDGVHAVSDGIESVWDCQEVEVFDGNASQLEKQYFVKYKGLAHLHNRWVPESEVLRETPSLLATYRETQRVARWKGEWTMARRLLQKRFFSHQLQDENCREHPGDFVDCNCEWLVKWLGLGYEHATWEAENASFMSSPDAKSLIVEYESRNKRMKKDQHSIDLEKQGMKIGPLVKLPPGLDDNHLDFLNNLRECWNKEQSSVLIDNQERLMKVVSFISLLLSHASWPFLIISTSASLSSWDEEFFCLASSVDVVVYHGDKDVRRGIRVVEFGEEGHFKMSQVVITSPEVISEDLDVFASSKWAAIVIDESQYSGMYAHFEQVKLLSAHMMLLLVNGQPKDEATEYLLSLLDYRSAKNGCEGLLNNSSLKERLSKYVVNSCKLDSRFLEYWVPVGISSIQLELLCANLLSNSFSLCSPLKTDQVGSLQNILRDARKCCDHPYLVDTTLQASLVKGREAEILDVGIKASGKLQLLDMMLSEIRSKGLRVLVLFQTSVGQGKINIGDILDDFVRQRFGCDSYERLDSFVVPSKRQAAMYNFNNQKGRFLFLLETRACSPSIKLSSVGVVIIFGSDWIPMNDIRNLQKITLDSKFEQIKVFRLYSSHTVEEKALILARQHNTLDGRTQNISRATSHMLLMWGASYHFDKLAEFHASNLHEQLLLKDIVLEFSVILPQNGKGDGPSICSLITKAQQTLGGYTTASPLPNERKIGSVDEELPHMFWKKLLSGKQPKWRFPSSSFQTQRKRERIQYFGDVQMDLAVQEEVSKKQKKIANNDMPISSLKPNLTKGNVRGPEKQGTSGSWACNAFVSGLRSTELCVVDEFSEAPKVNTDRLIEKVNLHDSQKSLHLSLKLKIMKLCEVLHLPETVKDMVGRFLDFVMRNHHVSRESATILQAFQISLCWTAASIVKHKLSHKESLELAKRHLKFGCKKEEADYVYSLLRCLKKLFLYRTGNLDVSGISKDPQISPDDLSKDPLYLKSSHPTEPNVQSGQAVSEHLRRSQVDHASDLGLAQNDFSKSIKDIESKFQKKMSKLLKKQKAEKEDVYRSSCSKDQIPERCSSVPQGQKAFEVVETASLNDKGDDMLTGMPSISIDIVDQTMSRLLIPGVQDTPISNNGSMNTTNPPSSDVQISMVTSTLPKVVSSSDALEEAGNLDGTVHPEREVNGFSAVASGDTSEINQQDTAVCMTEQDSHSSAKATVVDHQDGNRSLGGPEVCLVEQQDRMTHAELTHDNNTQPMDKIAIAGQPVAEVITPVPESAASGVNHYNSVGPSGEIDVILDNVAGHLSSLSLAEVTLENQLLREVPSEVPVTAAAGVDDHIDNRLGELESYLAEHQNGTNIAADLAGDPSSQSLVEGAVVDKQVGEVPTGALVTAAVAVVEDDFTGRENNEVAVVISHSTSCSNQQEGVIPSPTAQILVVVEDGNTVQVFHEVCPVPSDDIMGLNQTDEVVSFSVQTNEFLQLDSPSVLPVAALVEENSTAFHQAPCEESIQQHEAGSNSQSGNHSVQPAPAVRMPASSLSDPLEYELEIITKETEEIVRIHEDVKTQLKSDCEKEIEQEVARIREKYDAKLQETESIFHVKKEGVDAKRKKVLMNKVLAEAFRSKCLDIRGSSCSGTQQEMSSFMHQLHPQLSAASTALPSTGPSAGCSDTRLQAISPPVHLNSTAQRITAPLQGSSSVTPPRVSSFSPISGDLLPSCEMCAPPHLQHLRPATAMSGTSLSSVFCGMPSQLLLNNPSMISMPPQLRSGLPSSSHQHVHHNMIHRQPGMAGFLPPLSGSSLSAVELLMELDSQSRNGNTNLPNQTVLESNSLQPQINHQDTMRIPTSPTEFVCLSDDE